MFNIEFEKLFYETRPYIYGFIGLAAIPHFNDKLLFVSGLTLVACSALVLKMRHTFRSKPSYQKNITSKKGSANYDIYRI